MGVSTNGQLSFGIVFPSGYSFPWTEDEYENDIDIWWRKAKGYSPPFEVYDKNGNYLDTATPDRVDEYYDHLFDWQKANPLPVDLVNYCSGEYPMYLLAVPSVGYYNSRGFPEVVDPRTMENVREKDEYHAFMVFIYEYIVPTMVGTEVDLSPQWYLSSYWSC